LNICDAIQIGERIYSERDLRLPSGDVCDWFLIVGREAIFGLCRHEPSITSLGRAATAGNGLGGTRGAMVAGGGGSVYRQS